MQAIRQNRPAIGVQDSLHGDEPVRPDFRTGRLRPEPISDVPEFCAVRPNGPRNMAARPELHPLP